MVFIKAKDQLKDGVGGGPSEDEIRDKGQLICMYAPSAYCYRIDIEFEKILLISFKPLSFSLFILGIHSYLPELSKTIKYGLRRGDSEIFPFYLRL